MTPLTEPKPSPAPFPKLPPESDTRGVHLAGSRSNSMPELKDELASLRIDRDEPRRGRWRIPIVLLLLAVAVAGAVYYVRARGLLSSLGALEVQTVQASVESSANANAGTPILTASGYLVARKQSVVSSRIQGVISKLLVEEGSVVKEGDVLATLDNADHPRRHRQSQGRHRVRQG